MKPRPGCKALVQGMYGLVEHRRVAVILTRNLARPRLRRRGQRRGQRGVRRRGPPAAGVPVLAPAARGCPAVLAAPAAPRNSLRSLRELRSDNRGESEVRGALRAPAGTAALLGCAQARRQRAARAFADTVATCREIASPATVCAAAASVTAVEPSVPASCSLHHSRRVPSGRRRWAGQGGGPRAAGARAAGAWQAGRCLRRRAAQPRGRRAKRASYL
mgnify:CR=1 FL=1